MSLLTINGVSTPAALTQASNNPVLSKTDEKTRQVSQGFFTSLIKFIGTLILTVTFPLSLPLLYLAGKVKDLLSSSKSTPKYVELKNEACKSPGSLGSQEDHEQLLAAEKKYEELINEACKSPGSLGSQEDHEQLLEAVNTYNRDVIGHLNSPTVARNAAFKDEMDDLCVLLENFGEEPASGSNLSSQEVASPTTDAITTSEDNAALSTTEAPFTILDSENNNIAIESSPTKVESNYMAHCGIFAAGALLAILGHNMNNIIETFPSLNYANLALHPLV
jgi:hypothetical protein